ncbi:MAG: HK97 family phage prohead protease, partial [Pseudohongiellaceae bacterium]
MNRLRLLHLLHLSNPTLMSRMMTKMNLSRPYPNEHAARLHDPAQYDSLRRVNDDLGRGIDAIYGIKDETTELQAIRFDAAQFSADEARAWLDENGYEPIEFEEATGRAMDDISRDLEGQILKRAEVTDFQVAEDDRTIDFPFSSEYPVARYFGEEILSHERGAADLSRLNNGAPLLFNHDPDRVIGVVERGWIDDEKKRGYVSVRFSRNAFAQEVLADVKDGVLRNVSFGYQIREMDQRSDGEFVATSWGVHEVSVVSIPADPTVGVGRALDAQPAAPAAPQTPNPQPVVEMDNTPDISVVRAEAAAEAAKAERTRIAGITALTEKHGMGDLGRQLIESGRSIDEARAAVLDKLDAKPVEPVKQVEMDQRDAAQYSITAGIRAALTGDWSSRDAGLVREMSQEVERSGLNKTARNSFFVPFSALRATYVTSGATTGGNLVAT